MENNEIQGIANRLRQLTIRGIYQAQSGHPGGSLSICDIMAVLFFEHMNIDVANPRQANRDRFVLSKGHAAPAYYATLAVKGFFPEEDLDGLRSIDSNLQGHPCMNKVNGVDMSTGSLGQGLSAANGMALAGRLDGLDYTVYCICGDGELQEGQIWEAAMTSAHYQLDHLVLLIDHNKLQIDGQVKEIMNNESIEEKFRAFGWNTLTIDGHDLRQIDQAISLAKVRKGKPTCIICETVKGKGVSFMENQVSWHGTPPSKEQYELAMQELALCDITGGKL